VGVATDDPGLRLALKDPLVGDPPIETLAGQSSKLGFGHIEPAAVLGRAIRSLLTDLTGTTLLYVGGRAHQVAQLRLLAEQRGATLLHHDGGIDDRSGLLAAQVARASLVFFPVDCVSHNAVAVVKRVSRQIGKPYVALRSSGLTSFAVALAGSVERTRAACSEGSVHS
jgi:hypothetical protein